MTLQEAAMFMQIVGLAAFLLVLMVALGVVGNIVRGGWRPRWRVFYDANGSRIQESARPWWDKSDPLFSLLHAVVLAVPMGPLAIAAGAGNQLGAGPGWGQYVGTFLNGYFSKGGIKTPGPNKEIAVFDWFLRPLAHDPIKYGMGGMVFRGGLWALCSFLTIFLTLQALHVRGFNIDVPAHWWLGPCGYLFFPVGYVLGKRFFSPSNAQLAGEGINGGIFMAFWWGACL